MRYLPLPIVDDDAILQTISADASLAACPHLLLDKSEVIRRYHAYQHAKGNAASPIAPTPTTLQGILQNTLGDKYGSKAALFDYIENIRKAREINACPMCGAPELGSVDHIFPQGKFPDLAIFSRNLVPACLKCNSARQESYLGARPGERVLHPYFDRVEDRLFTAKIEATNGNYRRPKITTEILIHEQHPMYAVVNYHYKVTLMRTRVLIDMDKWWVDFQRKDEVYFRGLETAHFTDQKFSDAVDHALRLSDKEFTTVNNWKSFLFYGLSTNENAKIDLADTIRKIRSGNLRPDDI